MPLISLTFQNLPGDLDPSADIVAAYTADIDLGGTFSSSMTFEIGTTDHDSQGAVFFNDDVDTNSDGIGDGHPAPPLASDGDGGEQIGHRGGASQNGEGYDDGGDGQGFGKGDSALHQHITDDGDQDDGPDCYIE